MKSTLYNSLSQGITFKLLIIFLVIHYSKAKVVVLMSFPQSSSVYSYLNVARALAGLGHSAYVCVPRFMMDTLNTSGINVISYGRYLGHFDTTFYQGALNKFWRGENFWVTDFFSLLQSMQCVVRQILFDQALVSELRALNPDLFILSNGPLFRNMVVLPYMLNVSFVYMGDYNDLPGQRVPFSPSTTACFGYPEFKDKGMNFFDRLGTTVCNAMTLLADYYFMDDSLVGLLASNRIKLSVSDICKKVELYIIESDHILDHAKPEIPSMKLISSAALTLPTAELREPFRTFLEKAEAGIAMVTVVNLPLNVANKMAQAFRLQELSVVWRVNVTSSDIPRVLSAPWVPQNEILAHSNTRLFVSHCDTHNQYEALYHGVPMLCLPLYGDQFYNADRSKSKGFGLTANLATVSSKQLAKLMSKVSSLEKYRNSISRASLLFRMQYKHPNKMAAFWIDHVLKHGGSYMKSAAQEMPVYQFLMLDTLAALGIMIVILFVILVLVFWLLWKILRKCWSYFLNITKFKQL